MVLMTGPRLAELREDLVESFTPERVEAVLGPVARRALERSEPTPALRETAASDKAAAVLLRVFVLGAEVPRADLDRALPRAGTRVCVETGLVEAAGAAPDDEVRARVDLQPVEVEDALGRAVWWLASDQGEVATGRRLRADHVLGVGGASLTLARATIRSPRRRTLDLGTGCGIQALLAARHSAAVVATDVSARALDFAAFNAALADVRLDLRVGSMLEPVQRERFDLVVSNPPFVITPRGGVGGGARADGERLVYRDGGRAGDDLVRDLVLGVGDVLAPGGVAQLLGNWEQRRGEGWQERVGEWVDRAGLDAWVVQREVADPAEYAETWLRDGGLTPDRDRDAWRAGLRAWLDDFAARGVEAVGFGLVLLRRPARGRPTLRRLEELTVPLPGPLGGHLADALAVHDWLSVRDDAELAGTRLAPAPDVVEDRHHTPGDPEPRVVRLRQGAGFGRTVELGPALAGLVGALDGELTVGQVVAAMAALLDTTAELVAAEVLPPLRGLVRDRFLVPADDGS